MSGQPLTNNDRWYATFSEATIKNICDGDRVREGDPFGFMRVWVTVENMLTLSSMCNPVEQS